MKLTLKIEQDQDAENPRTAWDNFGKMVCWHSGYDLGDKHEFKDNAEFQRFWKKHEKSGVILPLYLYDHSGITISTGEFSCPWDSGQVGWIYATAAMIRKEYGRKRLVVYGDGTKVPVKDHASSLLHQEVVTYDQYLTGDVWGYVIEDEDGEEIESCWGFFGHDYCEQEGEAALAAAQEREDK